MAMYKNFRKDRKNRQLIGISLLESLKLKYFYNNVLFVKLIRTNAFAFLQKLNNGFLVQARNRCNITGRGAGVISKYKISRLAFRRLVSNGYITGFKKSSW